MTAFRVLLLSVFLTGSMALFSLVSNADEGQKIKVLNESAAALQSSHPDLAAKLTKYAKEEANEKGEGKKKADMSEADMKIHKEHMQLLKDAADALKTTKPELAKELNVMATHHNKHVKKEVKKETAAKAAVASK